MSFDDFRSRFAMLYHCRVLRTLREGGVWHRIQPNPNPNPTPTLTTTLTLTAHRSPFTLTLTLTPNP